MPPARPAPRPPLRRFAPLAAALGLTVAACTPDAKDDLDDSGPTGADGAGADGGAPDTGLSGGDGGGGAGGDGGGGGSTDADADGVPREQGDCDDADPLVHPGAIEIVGDSTDQDCDAKVDEVELTAVSALIRCLDARSVAVTGNGSLVFAGVLCTEAQAQAPDEAEPTDYWDSALAFATPWTTPGRAAPALYDWSRNLSDPSTELVSGQALVASDDALYGVVGLRTPSNSRASLRVGGALIDGGSRFGVNWSDRDLPEGLHGAGISVASDGSVTAIGCAEGAGPPRVVRAAAAVLQASSFDSAGTADALGDASACAVHHGGGAPVLLAVTGGQLRAAVAPAGDFEPEDLAATPLPGVDAGGLRADDGHGSPHFVYDDRVQNQLMMRPGDASPASAPATQLGDRADRFSVSRSADGGTLAVARTGADGVATLTVGAPGAAGDTWTLEPPPGAGTLHALEVHLSADGRAVFFAATDGVRLMTGAFRLQP